jgi:O-antigen ligase
VNNPVATISQVTLIATIAMLVVCLPLSDSNELMNGIQTAKSFHFFYGMFALVVITVFGFLFTKGKLKLSISAVDVLLLAICVSGAVQALYGNLQLWGYYPSHHGLFKMTGSFFNPGPYAGFLGAVLPVAVGLYWINNNSKFQVSGFRKNFKFQVSSSRLSSKQNSTSNKQPETCNLKPETSNLKPLIIKHTALIIIVLVMLVLPAARSRAAWLGAIAGVAYLAWHKYNISQKLKRRSHQTFKLFKRTYNIRNWVIYTVVALMLTAGSLTLYFFKKDSADGRMLIWTVTANIIKDNPMLGVGQDMLKAHYMDYQAAYFRKNPDSKYEQLADDNQYTFNEPLNIWAENGLIGILLFGGLLFMVFFKRKEFDAPLRYAFEATRLKSLKLTSFAFWSPKRQTFAKSRCTSTIFHP